MASTGGAGGTSSLCRYSVHFASIPTRPHFDKTDVMQRHACNMLVLIMLPQSVLRRQTDSVLVSGMNRVRLSGTNSIPEYFDFFGSLFTTAMVNCAK